MAFLANILGPKQPVTLRVLTSQENTAWVDADNNGKIDDGDAYLVLEKRDGSEYVDFKDLKQALEGKGPQSDKQVCDELARQYHEPEGTFAGTSIVNGSMCFDMVSTFKQSQEFKSENGEITLTLTPTENDTNIQGQATTAHGNISLVKGEDGVLRWQFPEPAPPPPPPENAVKEATLVERDGVLHWLFPGEVPNDGDKIIGNPDTAADNLLKRT